MTTEMIYSNKYTYMTRDELVKAVSSKMSEKRFQHVLRVEKKAIELAHLYGVDIEQASIAALTHDYAKERPDEEMKELIRTKGFDLDLLEFGNPIWHGIVGAYLVKKELGITDELILTAIQLHTTGAKEMSELDKVIYVSDYVEEGRNFPDVEKARQLANDNLDDAVAFETQHTLHFLVSKRSKIYPKTLETYNKWVVKY